MSKVDQKLEFPKGFLWGTATAAHQIEGDNFNNDWWQWEQDGHVKEKSGKACDSWNRWKEDIDLAKSLNNNAYRFSIEWSRIEPEEGKFDLFALKHYENQIKYLHKLGMKAVLTLWHFTLPRWFTNKGGFTKRKNLVLFERYVNYILDNLEVHPDIWVVMNEPNTYIGRSFLNGDWPPGYTSKLFLPILTMNLTLVGRRIYKLIHNKIRDAVVGNCFHFVCFEYFGRNPLFKIAQRGLNILNNELSVIFSKSWSDFIGVNYYIVHIISLYDFIPKKIFVNPQNEQKLMMGRKNDIGWNIYPQGIYKILKNLGRFHLPIFITEVGVADKADLFRKNYISDILEWVQAAIKENIDIKGFFHWSLIDNFEWALGTLPKFGLFETDFTTFERKPRKSAKFYAIVCKKNALEIMRASS